MIEDKIPSQISISENEEVKMVLRRKFISILFIGIIAIIIISLIVGIIVYAYLGNIEIFLLVFLTPIGVVIALLFLLGYPYTNGHRYIVTNRRIIIYKKFISITIRDISLINITDLILQVGIFGRIFGYGTIFPISAGLEAAIGPGLFIQLSGISNVFETRNNILEYKRRAAGEIPAVSAMIEYESELEEPVIPYVKILQDEKIYSLLKRNYWSFFFKIVWFFGIFLGFSIYFLYQFFITEISNSDKSRISFIFTIIYKLPLMSSSQFNFFIILSFIFLILTTIFGFVLIFGIPYVQSHRYYITNRRLIMFKKFIWITYREVFYEKITDIIVKIGPIARLLKYGGLRPITAGMEYGLGSSLLSIEGIMNVSEIRNKIMNIKSSYKQEIY